MGEVVESPEELKTYKDDKEMQQQKFAITVSLWLGRAPEPVRAKPASHSIQQIPLIGEHVLLFKGTNQYSTNDVTEEVWYYLPAYPIFSNVSENILPGISDLRPKTKTPVLTREEALKKEAFGKTFEDEEVPPIQPYEGDIIYQGRFGNVIRLGSTVKEGGEYSKETFWGGDNNGAPIITLTTNSVRSDPDEELVKFRTEDLTEDDSSLYLTSTQTIKFDLSKSTKHTDELSTYNRSQLIGSANRIILQAKEDSIILDAKKRITLNSEKTYIGSEDANIPLTDTTELAAILQELISALAMNSIDLAFGTPVHLNGLGTITGLIGKLEKIKSKKHFMDKEQLPFSEQGQRTGPPRA